MTVPLWLALTVPLVWPRPTVTVEGHTACPTPAEVEARVAAVLPPMSGMRAPDVAVLDDELARLRVTLRRADGTLIGRRWLQRSFACADLAAAVSVVLAAWESDVHPEFRLDIADHQPTHQTAPPSLVEPPPIVATTAVVAPRPVVVPAPAFDPPPLRASRRTGAPSPGVASQRPPTDSSRSPFVVSVPVVVASAPGPSMAVATTSFPVGSVPPRPPVIAASLSAPASAPPVAVAAHQAASASTPARSTVDVGAAAFGALAPVGDAANAGAAIGAVVTVGWTRAQDDDAGWGARTGLSATTERETRLSSGTARWRRFALALGAHRRWVIGSHGSLLDLHADVIGAVLAIRGTGFASNLSDMTLDPGFATGVRLTLGHGRLRPWADLAIRGWLFPHVVYEHPLDNSATLPRFEALLALGVSFWLGG